MPDTGTNACYMEEARHVAALDEDRGRVCVSVEWGSFGDDGALGPLLTAFDHALDLESLNPHAQRWLAAGVGEGMGGCSLGGPGHTQRRKDFEVLEPRVCNPWPCPHP